MCKTYAWKKRFTIAVFVVVLFSAFAQISIAQQAPDSDAGYMGMSIAGWWRPFADNSPWNTPIPSTAVSDPDSGSIINTVLASLRISGGGNHLRFATKWSPPIHFVNSEWSLVPKYYFHSSTDIYHYSHTEPSFDPDPNADDVTDVAYAYNRRRMFAEPTDDGHLIIIDVKIHYISLLWK